MDPDGPPVPARASNNLISRVRFWDMRKIIYKMINNGLYILHPKEAR